MKRAIRAWTTIPQLWDVISNIVLCLLLSMSPQLKKNRCLQGTVKTSTNHPAQGPTQMFRRGLDADSFGNVCSEPRYHTGASYQVCMCSNMIVQQSLILAWSHSCSRWEYNTTGVLFSRPGLMCLLFATGQGYQTKASQYYPGKWELMHIESKSLVENVVNSWKVIAISGSVLECYVDVEQLCRMCTIWFWLCEHTMAIVPSFSKMKTVGL